MKITSKLLSYGLAVTIATCTMSISANAFSGAKYKRTTGGSYTNPVYVSCYITGARTAGVVSGLAWTKTSSNKSNVYNPNCNFTGYSYVSTQVGGVGSGSTNNNAGSAQCSIYLTGCTTSKTVTSQHIFSSSYYGSADHSFSLSSG